MFGNAPTWLERLSGPQSGLVCKYGLEFDPNPVEIVKAWESLHAAWTKSSVVLLEVPIRERLLHAEPSGKMLRSLRLTIQVSLMLAFITLCTCSRGLRSCRKVESPEGGTLLYVGQNKYQYDFLAMYLRCMILARYGIWDHDIGSYSNRYSRPSYCISSPAAYAHLRKVWPACSWHRETTMASLRNTYLKPYEKYPDAI